MKKKLFGFIISFFGLYLAFNKLNFNDLKDVLLSVDWLLIIFATSIMILSVLIRSIRWQILLKPFDNFQIYNLFSSTMIGYFGNSVLPLKLGEFLRANTLNKIYPSMPVSTIFATITIERLLDLIGAFFLIIVLMSTNDVPNWFSNSFFILVLFMFFIILFVIFLVQLKKNFLIQNFTFFKTYSFLKKINLIVNNFIDGIRSIKSLDQRTSILFYTFMLWFMYWISVWLCIVATNINISFFQAGIVLFATGMVIAIPSAPGYIGTFHATAVLILSDYFLISISKAQAFAILNHFVGFIPMVIIGGTLFIKSSFGLSVKRKNGSTIKQ